MVEVMIVLGVLIAYMVSFSGAIEQLKRYTEVLEARLHTVERMSEESNELCNTVVKKLMEIEGAVAHDRLQEIWRREGIE